MKEAEMGGACSTHVEMINIYKMLLGKTLREESTWKS
jgi:hypothetical protein